MKKDIVIIGAGPAGLSFARSLANTGLQIAIVEASETQAIAEPAIDGRDIALTHFSKSILQGLGVWARFPADAISPIKEAKVLDGNSPYILHFDHEGVSDDALGYLISNHLIRKALFDETQTLSNVDLITAVSVDAVSTTRDRATVALSNGSAIEAALVVAADSRFSASRRNMGISASMYDFGRVAIVCRMQHERPNPGIAYECFHYGRTLAVLPLSGNQSSIVITVGADQSNTILGMTEEQFNRDIEHRFANRLGRMELIGDRYPYPLVAVWADRFAATRFALIGDAAVGMHPVTAHGFNLGLRGQHTLSTLIKSAVARGGDIGSPALLRKYQVIHRRVARPIYLGTNAIVKLYTDDSPLPKLVRKAVLRFSNNLPPIKHAIINQLTELRQSRMQWRSGD